MNGRKGLGGWMDGWVNGVKCPFKDFSSGFWENQLSQIPGVMNAV